MQIKKSLCSISLIISFCYSTIVFAAAPASMFPIKPQLLQKVTLSPQAQQDTYWLTIPGGNQVLIGMNAPNTTPMIDAPGNANFKYVSDYLHKSSFTFSDLPAGLYYWHNHNKGISSSAQGPTWRSTPTGYKSNDRLWDTTRAHDKHPFALSDIPNMVQAPASQPAVKQEVKTFSIASVNILNERPYLRFSNNQGMPLAQRQGLFNAAFNDPQQLQGKNFIAFQECEPNSNPALPAHVKNSLVIDGDVAIYYDQSKFIKTATEFKHFTTPGATNRGFLVLNVKTNDARKNNIMIINTHFEGGPGGALGYLPFREKQLQEIIDYIINNVKTTVHLIICGDFNTDSQDKASYNTIKNAFDGFSDALGSPHRATSYSKKLEGLDYLFYTPNLKLINTQIYPAAQVMQSDLLHHDANDVGRPYFSDHAIISAEFSFKSSSASSAKPAAAASSSSSAAKKLTPKEIQERDDAALARSLAQED